MADAQRYYRDAEGDVWAPIGGGRLKAVRVDGEASPAGSVMSRGDVIENYGPLHPCDEFGNRIPGENMAIRLDFGTPKYAKDDLVTHNGAAATVTYGPLRGRNPHGELVYIIRYGDYGDEVPVPECDLSPRAEFEPDQRVLWCGDECIVLSGPHRDHLGSLRYGVQDVSDGSLSYALACDVEARP